jgi:hypothetical protein
MIKKIVVSFCLFIGIIAFAQKGTSSPYSFYGIGDIKFKGTAEIRSMGGISFLRDSIHLNLQNPASLSRLIYTTFTVGGSTSQTELATSSAQNASKNTSIDYLALGFPVGKFGVSVSLMPYSSVGYNILNTNPTPEIAAKSFDGSGGISKVSVGVAYNITTQLSAGLNIESNFGKITTNSTTGYNNIQYATREFNESAASGVSFSTGLMYNSKFKSKTQISAGLTYTPSTNLNFINQRVLFREEYLQANGETQDVLNVDTPDTQVKLPSKFSIGFGLGENRKWQVGLEIVNQNNSNFGNRFNDINNVTYENANQYKIGGFYIPKYNSFTSYFQRVTYRGGFNYQNTGLIINGKSIKEQTFSLGLGLPLGGSISNLNIGFEIGKRGTKFGGLVTETYQNLIIGLSLNDKWFTKRKFD